MELAQKRALEEYYYVPIYINSFTLGVGGCRTKVGWQARRLH